MRSIRPATWCASWLAFLPLPLTLTLASSRTLRAQELATHPRIKEATTLVAKWIDAERAFKRIPGVSGAVVYRNQMLWQGGSGYADLERKAPALPTTLYSICSISKLFPSLAVLQLRDKGLLRLDD